MWQQGDDNTTRTWTDAGTYCEGLTLGSKSDWRLPDKKELASIADYGGYSPAIDTTAFPNTNSSSYWSSTSLADSTSYAWSVRSFSSASWATTIRPVVTMCGVSEQGSESVIWPFVFLIIFLLLRRQPPDF